MKKKKSNNNNNNDNKNKNKHVKKLRWNATFKLQDK